MHGGKGEGVKYARENEISERSMKNRRITILFIIDTDIYISFSPPVLSYPFYIIVRYVFTPILRVYPPVELYFVFVIGNISYTITVSYYSFYISSLNSLAVHSVTESQQNRSQMVRISSKQTNKQSIIVNEWLELLTWNRFL